MKFTLAAISSLAVFAPTALATTIKGTITITNLAPEFGTCLTPPWVAIHSGGFDTYTRNEPSSPGLESLAEDGRTETITQEFADSGELYDATVGDGPFCYGESVTASYEVTISGDQGALYFSYASMILPSNDFFVSNGDPLAHMLRDSDGNNVEELTFTVLGTQVLDAGTEVNDEIPANVAFLEQMNPDTGDTEVGGTVQLASAFNGFNAAGTGGILDATAANGQALTGADFLASGYEVMYVKVTFEVKGEGGGGGSCFSENAMVNVQGAGDVAMKDLKVGDNVLTGKNQYQPVYAFGHYATEERAEFLKISHKAGSALEMTGDHLVYLDGSSTPVRADALKVGDVLTHHQDGASEVTKISKASLKGLYAPLTNDGTIVVNGIVASTYATLMKNVNSEKIVLNGYTMPFIDQNTFMHAAVSPLRMVCRLTGSSLDLCTGAYDAKGYNSYVSWGNSMIYWAQSLDSTVVQFGLAGAFFALFSMINLVDFATSNNGLLLVAAVAGFVAVNKSKKNVKTVA